MNSTHLTEPVKHLGDMLSVGTVIATLLGWLPHIAALLTISWTLLRIYETWLGVQWRRARLQAKGKRKTARSSAARRRSAHGRVAQPK